VLTEQSRVQLNHLAATDGETCFFKAANDFATDALFHSIGLQEDEGLLHSGNIVA
jgi:hypothetical protein